MGGLWEGPQWSLKWCDVSGPSNQNMWERNSRSKAWREPLRTACRPGAGAHAPPLLLPPLRGRGRDRARKRLMEAGGARRGEAGTAWAGAELGWQGETWGRLFAEPGPEPHLYARGHPRRPPRPLQVQFPRLPSSRIPIGFGQGRAPAGVWAAEERGQGFRPPPSVLCGVSTEGPTLGFGSVRPPSPHPRPWGAVARWCLAVCSSNSFVAAPCLKSPPWSCPTGAVRTRGASEARCRGWQQGGRGWPRGGTEHGVGRREFGWFVRVGLQKAGQVETRGTAEARRPGGEPSS